MGLRTRFEENLRESNPGPSRELLSIDELPASTSVASALALTPGDPVTLVTVLAIAEEAHGTRSQTNGIQIRQEKTPTNETGPY
jgi:DNA-binding GntR family transcriptional regulator